MIGGRSGMLPFSRRSGAEPRVINFGRALPALPPSPAERERPDWMQARVPSIRAALGRARALPSGGWYVVDASRHITARPSFYWVDGHEVVAWRSQGRVCLAPNACPHMGAPLSAGRSERGELVCPWHGLRLGEQGQGQWKLHSAHDDGILTWIRLGPPDPATPLPVIAPRPARAVDSVIRMVAQADPEDVIANRLDPWHGVHFHPHSFARLRVLGDEGGVITLRVAFRVLGPLCVEVDATFHCPEPNTIVMTIVAGDGSGSVVETHATPLFPGTSAIVEATLATSDRPGFGVVLRGARLLRPLVQRAARRLWVEDSAYAERTRYLRTGQRPGPRTCSCWKQAPGTPRPR
jgi:hypothetical protein